VNFENGGSCVYEELYNSMYSSPDVMRIIRFTKMKEEHAVTPVHAILVGEKWAYVRNVKVIDNL
jgi:hypothetical protein